MSDEGFLSELYHSYYAVVLNYCAAMLDGDMSDAADCAQAVFDAAAGEAERLKNHPNIVGWLKRTSQFRAKRILRTRQRRSAREIPITAESDRYIAALRYVEMQEENNYAQFSIDEAKADVLSRLLPDERQIYEMRFTQGMTNKDIAKAVGLSESGMRMRLLRVETKLRELVKEYFDNRT